MQKNPDSSGHDFSILMSFLIKRCGLGGHRQISRHKGQNMEKIESTYQEKYTCQEGLTAL